eukprot:gene36305-47245_t
MDFSNEEIECCVKVGKSAKVIQVQAGVLKSLLIARNIFTTETTHAEVVGNSDFMDLLHKYIMLGFSDDITESHYGKVGETIYTDDFNLLQIPPKEMANHFDGISAQDCAKLIKNRKNALAALGRTRDTMVHFMNFEDTPLRPSPTKNKKEVAQSLTTSLESMTLQSNNNDSDVSSQHSNIMDNISDVTTEIDMVSIASRALRLNPTIRHSPEFESEEEEQQYYCEEEEAQHQYEVSNLDEEEYSGVEHKEDESTTEFKSCEEQQKNGKYGTSRWGDITSHLPADQFFTPPNAIIPIINFIAEFKDKVVFEPSCGQGHIANVLMEQGFHTIIQRDLYTVPEHHDDYLNTEDPDYDILITNPPFCCKYEFLEKAYASKKPFAMLLPMDTFTTLHGHNIFSVHGVFIGAFYRRVQFITPE